ncbi:hypothetical protein ACGFYY_37300 [Streptomyces sp. NPDC048331]|uniref:hypothetical protein n=1 Tax=Streptomyces sp. NPDC048331 TaxID=3365534 RepID=UPI0037163D63
MRSEPVIALTSFPSSDSRSSGPFDLRSLNRDSPRGGQGIGKNSGENKKPFAQERAAGTHPLPPGTAPTSVPNSFAGIVTAVRLDDVPARVKSTEVPIELP